MGIYAIVEPEYADLVIDRLGLDIGREQRNAITKATGVRVKTADIVIILDDNKTMSPDKKTSYVYSKSDYVIAKDGSKSFYLAVRYIGKNEKGETIEGFEPLKDNKESADKRNERRLSELNKEIEDAKKSIEQLEGEISILEGKRNTFKEVASGTKNSANNIIKKYNKKLEEYEKLVDKIEMLRKNFLIKVLFRIYKLELD